jgi:DNA topoisomerase I
MDILRKNSNGAFYYVHRKTKKKINNKTMLTRIKSLRIPPAYKHVLIASNPNSKVQCIGTDTKNRNQYIYNKEHIENQTKLKFNDLITFGKKIKRIRKDIITNLNNCYTSPKLLNNKDNIISLVLYLIDSCNFRVGCEKYKQLYNSFGVTTLNKSHFKINSNNITIEFIGKKGILNTNNVKNTNICNLLKTLCNNDDDYIFNYLDGNNDKYRITEKHINDFLKKYHKSLSVKMFRTWNANYILLKEILNLDLPENETQAKKNINIAIKKAAVQLHHSSNVSKKSYMNNEIVDLYLTDPMKFKRLIELFRKSNGNLPTINRLLNLILYKLK